MLLESGGVVATAAAEGAGLRVVALVKTGKC
jgi:hypothetical protein